MNQENYALNRLREPSTWRGLIWLATAAGITIAPEAIEAIVVLGTAAAGAVGVLTKDKSTEPSIGESVFKG